MAEIHVRITAHIVDEVGNVVTQVASADSVNAGGNPAFFGQRFTELAMQQTAVVRNQITAKHGEIRTHGAGQ